MWPLPVHITSREFRLCSYFECVVIRDPNGAANILNTGCCHQVPNLGGLDIADDVMIGPNVSIITASHPFEPSQRRAATIGKPIVIGRNVWIAAGATIVGGVTVGENSVVAAGSVVTKDVPPNALVGGNPARVIRSIGD